HTVHLVDGDGDGAITNNNADGYVAVGGGTVGPFRNWIVTPAGRWRVKIVAEGGTLVAHAIEVPYACPNEDRRRALALINQWRAQMGLSPCDEDAGLSAACEKHCQYMSCNRVV